MTTTELASFVQRVTLLLLLLFVTNDAVTGAPVIQAAVTSSGASDVISSCYTAMATSTSWYATSGPWAHPCTASSSTAPSAEFQTLWNLFFSPPTPTLLSADAVALFREAADLASSLTKQIVRVNMHNAVAVASSVENHTIIQVPANNTSDVSNQTQALQHLYAAVSLGLAFLEQSRHDQSLGCARLHPLPDPLVRCYDDLTTKTLRGLCKVREMLDSASRPVVNVPRSAVPGEWRNLTMFADSQVEVQRACRDYVISRDVRVILSHAAQVLESSDWSSV